MKKIHKARNIIKTIIIITTTTNMRSKNKESVVLLLSYSVLLVMILGLLKCQPGYAYQYTVDRYDCTDYQFDLDFYFDRDSVSF